MTVVEVGGRGYRTREQLWASSEAAVHVKQCNACNTSGQRLNYAWKFVDQSDSQFYLSHWGLSKLALPPCDLLVPKLSIIKDLLLNLQSMYYNFFWLLLNKIHFYDDLSYLTRLNGPPVIYNLRIASEFPLLNIIEILIAVSLLICNYHGAWMLHLEMCVTVLHLIWCALIILSAQ